VANVQYLDYYSSLNHYGPAAGQENPSGFFFVRHAAKDDEHYGDPDVRKGWAMYIFDPTKYKQGVQNSGWVRIAQQLDVDWDIDDELKAQFVLQDTFNKFVNKIEARSTRAEARISANETLLSKITKRNTSSGEPDRGRLDIVEDLAHAHKYILDGVVQAESNQWVLNMLYDKYGMLYYRGAPISGNSYIYSRVHNDKIWWLDPTDQSAEPEEVEVVNSAAIADLFSKTSLARIGLTLIVVEVDGSLSLYKMTAEGEITIEPMQFLKAGLDHEIDYENRTIDGFSNFVSKYTDLDPLQVVTFEHAVENVTDVYIPDGEKVSGFIPELVDKYGYVYSVTVKGGILPAFVETVTDNGRGIIETCTTLPTASAAYVGRGLWSPTVTDHVHKVGNLFKCVEDSENPGTYVWQDVTITSDGVSTHGAIMLSCFHEDDTMWTRTRVTWKDPEDTTYRWKKTVLVRKYGSAPADISDGEILCVETVRDSHSTAATAFLDTNVDPQLVPYYKVFSFTIDDLPYLISNKYSKKEAKCFTWADWTAVRLLTTDDLKRWTVEAIFQVGDTVVLPPHPVYGSIECTVVALNKNYLDQDVAGGLTLCANKPVFTGKMSDPESNGTLTNGKYELMGLDLLQYLNNEFLADWYFETGSTLMSEVILTVPAQSDIPKLVRDVFSGFYRADRPGVVLPVKHAEWFSNISDELKAVTANWWTMNGTLKSGDATQNSGFYFGNEGDAGSHASTASAGVVPVFCI
jgi:hypothetical protein